MPPQACLARVVASRAMAEDNNVMAKTGCKIRTKYLCSPFICHHSIVEYFIDAFSLIPFLSRVKGLPKLKQ